MNRIRRAAARIRQLTASEEGSLAPVVVLSLVAVMVTAMAALAVSASLITSAKNMNMVDASTTVTLDFADQIKNKPASGVLPGDGATVESAHNGLSRQQELVMSDDMLIIGFRDDGTYVWGPSQGVQGSDGVWLRQWGNPGVTP